MKKPDILVSFGAATEQFDRAVKGIRGKVSGLVSSFRGLSSQIGAAFGIGAGIAGVGSISFIKNLANDLDNLAKTSRSLGVTVERMKELEFAVGQTSQLDLSGLTLQLQKITKNIGDAAAGSQPMIDTFQRLGLEIEQLQQMTPDEAYLTVIEALGKMTDEYERAKIAQRLFEDSWRQTILLAKAGRGTLEDLAEQQRAMGGPTTEAAEAAEKFNDSLDVLNKNMDALAYTYGPPVIEFFNNLYRMAGKGRTPFEEMNAEMVVLQDKMRAMTDPSLTQWLVQLLNGGLTPEERAARIKGLQEQIDDLMATYAAARKKQDEADKKTAALAPPIVKAEKEKQDAIKKTTAARAKSDLSQEESLDRTRETVKAEGAYWQAEHDLISALQDDNAEAVEDARNRMKLAIQDMTAAGGSDFRVRYYEDLEKVSDADIVPKLKFTPTIDQEGLEQMNEQIRESLRGQNFRINIQPIMAAGTTNALQWDADQSGHDET